MRNRLQLLLQAMLVLVASLLGIVTNYATSENEAPWLLHLLQQVAIPAIGLLIVTMVVMQIVVHRLENPAPPPTDWPHDRVPYPGLDAFVEDEAAVFFGRENQSEDLTRRLHAPQNQPVDRFLVLVGASGSGKSSLVRAGVLPRLRVRRWSILPAFSPGPNPLGALASAISTAGGEHESAGAVLRRLRQDPASVPAELARLRGSRFRHMLVVVDQFEEIITLAGERERAQFLEALHACVTQDARIRVLATLRVEFLGQLLGTRHAELFQHPVAIGALGRNQLAQVVERPGALVGLSFAPGVVEAFVNDVGTDDALPLLAYLLQELYFASGPGETVSEELYHSLGGVAGALARQADDTVSELGCGDDGIDFVLKVLLRFVTVQGQEVARRRVPLAELTAQERRVVDAFVDARLLMSDVHAGQDPYAQVTHEALFRQWAPLRQEVEAHTEQLRQRAELERWAEDWDRSGRSPDYLLTGERLTLARRWLQALQETGQASGTAQSLVEFSQRRDLAFCAASRTASGSTRSAPRNCNRSTRCC
ncbi:ATP-binding protein [Streptomyces sp. NL15-2K]|uniref:ATP-binding protein n=1 Tax=Streptomyces sp. NL15-2K TaxID=376149 RepID=UPI000FF94A05|nr:MULTISPECIES: ATP-binding protein [Actinomycetes]WKX09478.1 ATP-binding protein [Kutzneria buriramensis]GCB49012.1 high-affnity carbon uptake protein hat/hatR [Streptomyces sp. NL15-2K]